MKLEAGGDFDLEGGGVLLLEAVMLGSEINAGSIISDNQYQQTMTINPLNADWMAIVMKSPAETTSQLLCTQDGGSTWNSFALGSGNSASDTYCLYDFLGNLHVVALEPSNPLLYQCSTDGGVTLSTATRIGSAGSPTSPDHPVIMVNPNSGTYANYIYVAADPHSADPYQYLFISTDSGITWSTATLTASSIVPSSGGTHSLATGTPFGGVCLPSGKSLYTCTTSGNFDGSFNEYAEIYALSSSDGGATIDYVDVTPIFIPVGTGPQYLYPSNMVNIGSSVYFVMTQGSSSGPTVMRMCSSSDEGATWSGPTTIFTPATGENVKSACMLVNKYGVLGVQFILADSGRSVFDTYFIYSIDGGSTWSSAIRISSQTSTWLPGPFDTPSGTQPRTPGQDQNYGAADPSTGDFWVAYQDARGTATQYTTYIRKVTVG